MFTNILPMIYVVIKTKALPKNKIMKQIVTSEQLRCLILQTDVNINWYV